jgi:dipeptidyl aminopeptidase/acylaminoacyl peptidase
VDDEYMFSTIHSLTLDGKLEPLARMPGKLGPMAFSPDGRQLAFLGAVSVNDPLAQSLFLMPADGGTPRNLTGGLEASGTDVLWSGRGLYMLASLGARQAVYLIERNNTPRRIDWPRLIVTHWDAGAGGDVVALAAHAPEHPTELYLWRPGSRPVRGGDHNPPLAAVRLARQETLEWPGADGLKITGVLTYPLDYEKDRRYPLILQVHGGPEGVSLDGWTTSAGYPVQLLAARGYVVLQPNYRGSQGRGIDFSKADHDDLGGLEFDDILAGIDNLAARGLIDPERVGTGGWSYGGYMSAWAATRHTERFKAAIVCAGLTNWISFAGTTDIPYEMSLVHWDSWWFDEPALHWARSPMAHLNQARTPTLLVHGLKDERVHPEQSLQMYQGLRIKEVPTELVLYPREPHGLNERAHELDYVERVLDWFDTYVAGSGAEPTDP